MKKHVHVMNTAFRDGFQSAYGARVLTPDFLPALEAACHAGIDHHEIGGGARFQSLYFYCNEDAFAMHDAARAVAGPNANFQTLSRGINVVGLDSQPRDIIKLHADLFKKHSITTIRNFDALNDVDNLIYSGQCIADAGLNHEVCVTMMELPPGATGAHTAEFYMQTLRAILDAGIPFHSVCFKDAAGTAVPSKVFDTIKAARAMLGDDVHIVFHTHDTAGIGISQYMAALKAGADQIDLSLAPVSGGTCQPDIVSMWHALRGTEFDMGFDIPKVLEAEEVFKECMKDYFMPPEALAIEPRIPFSPMPGGALTANTQMLRDNNLLHRYHEMIDAMADVIARGGFGTSVTPVSQFYFQQAFNNVMFGPWKKMADGYGRMVLGYFGKTPVPPDPEVVRLAAEQLGMQPTTESPLELNERDPNKGSEAAKKVLTSEGLPITDENIFIAATCKEKGIAYLQGKARVNVRKNAPEKAPAAAVAAGGGQAGAASGGAATGGASTYTIEVSGKRYAVVVDGTTVTVDGTAYPVAITATGSTPAAGIGAAAGPSGTGASAGATAAAASSTPPTAAPAVVTTVEAPMPGLVLRITAAAGAQVKAGDEVLVLEAMKMETPIAAPVDGTVREVLVESGDQVAAETPLMRIG